MAVEQACQLIGFVSRDREDAAVSQHNPVPLNMQVHRISTNPVIVCGINISVTLAQQRDRRNRPVKLLRYAKNAAKPRFKALWLIIGAPEEIELLPGAKTRPDLSLIYPVDPKQLPKELAGVEWPEESRK